MKKISKTLLFTSLSAMGVVAVVVPTVVLTSCSVSTPTQPEPKQVLDTSSVTTFLEAYQFMSKNLRLDANRIAQNLNWNAFVKIRNITNSNLANKYYTEYEDVVNFYINSFTSNIAINELNLRFKLSGSMYENLNYVKPTNQSQIKFWKKDSYKYNNLDAQIVLVESRIESTNNKCYYPAILIGNKKIDNGQITADPNNPSVYVDNSSQERTDTTNTPSLTQYSYNPAPLNKIDYNAPTKYVINSGSNNVNNVDYSILQTDDGLICALPYEGIRFTNLK